MSGLINSPSKNSLSLTPMLNKSLFLALLLFTVPGLAWQQPSICIEGKIKTRPLQKEIVEASAYCTNKDGTELLAQVCQNKKKPCQALSFVGTRDKSKLAMTAFGTPGFHLCTELKGDAQIIEFTIAEGQWSKLDRCLFNDGSYIDMGSLLEVTYK